MEAGGGLQRIHCSQFPVGSVNLISRVLSLSRYLNPADTGLLVICRMLFNPVKMTHAEPTITTSMNFAYRDFANGLIPLLDWKGMPVYPWCAFHFL